MEEDSNNWDLHAVVRGCCLPRPGTAAAATCPFSSFPPLLPKEEAAVSGEEEALSCFPDLMAAASFSYDLEELCKPFLLNPHQQTLELQQEQQQPRQPHRPLSETQRSKRRKSQQKREVCQVPADGVSADLWAWRKYGQKPIKGSPYPRGYYRCSSSKGCLARKQVERSPTDPGMLVITYTAEHNHPAPAHRNSLAGSVRQKLPPPRSSTANAAAGGDSETVSTAPNDPPEEEEELSVGDMEMVGEDDLLFWGLDVDAPVNKPASAGPPVGSGFLREDGGLAKRFFGSPWLANSSATAAASGS